MADTDFPDLKRALEKGDNQTIQTYLNGLAARNDKEALAIHNVIIADGRSQELTGMALVNRGDLYRKQGNIQAAADDYNRADKNYRESSSVSGNDAFAKNLQQLNYDADKAAGRPISWDRKISNFVANNDLLVTGLALTGLPGLLRMGASALGASGLKLGWELGKKAALSKGVVTGAIVAVDNAPEFKTQIDNHGVLSKQVASEGLSTIAEAAVMYFSTKGISRLLDKLVTPSVMFTTNIAAALATIPAARHAAGEVTNFVDARAPTMPDSFTGRGFHYLRDQVVGPSFDNNQADYMGFDASSAVKPNNAVDLDVLVKRFNDYKPDRTAFPSFPTLHQSRQDWLKIKEGIGVIWGDRVTENRFLALYPKIETDLRSGDPKQQANAMREILNDSIRAQGHKVKPFLESATDDPATTKTPDKKADRGQPDPERYAALREPVATKQTTAALSSPAVSEKAENELTAAAPKALHKSPKPSSPQTMA